MHGQAAPDYTDSLSPVNRKMSGNATFAFELTNC